MYKHPQKENFQEIHKLIIRIGDVKKRNQLRGLNNKNIITKQIINTLRDNNSRNDIALIGAILRGNHGLWGTSLVSKKSSSDIYKTTILQKIEWDQELCYAIGSINQCKKETIEILNRMKPLSILCNASTEDALNNILEFAKIYGASTYLSTKLAYIQNIDKLDGSHFFIISKIEEEILHQEQPDAHFSILENFNSRIPLFSIIQRRISSLGSDFTNDFRKWPALSSFISTPLDYSDIGSLLLRSTETSLVDVISSLIIFLNLSKEYPLAEKLIIKYLDPLILEEIHKVISYATTSTEITNLFSQLDGLTEYSEYSLDLYRNSSAFLENKQITLYRHHLDKVIGARLMYRDFFKTATLCNLPNSVKKEQLLAHNGTNVHDLLPKGMDLFYRTFLFLSYISTRENISTLSVADTRYVFENTIGLEVLLTEQEMTTLHTLTPSGVTRGLVSILALALYRKKIVDPDIDFKFRSKFIAHVKKEYNGSINDFITDLLTDSPSIANYIVSSLDEVTIEKMYSLVEDASAAASIRRDILRAVGQKMNRIEYFIQADAIETREKVSSLQNYFDSSRIYVDNIAMKKWLDANPSISAEQYRSIYPSIIRIDTAIDAETDKKTIIISVEDTMYLVRKIAKDAFDQFCLNQEFGIQSYLGRRIRHNTLQGVMVEAVDAVFRKNEHSIAQSNFAVRAAIDSWMDSYKKLIEQLRRDHLQFRPSNSYFNAQLNFEDPATNENIFKLALALNKTGDSELFNDMVIAFCWRQISPQLEGAARHIKTSLLHSVKSSIDYVLGRVPSLADGKLVSDLHQAVNDVFKQVASWFQIPHNGFVTASIKDLCQIILLDLGKNVDRISFSGACINRKYTGISVHRIYDCLAVLIQNAIKHGKDNAPINVDINSTVKTDSVLAEITITISSRLDAEDDSFSISRISDAVNSNESGVDMITEGYSGIKKIKIITKSNEGKQHTVKFNHDHVNNILHIGFSLRAELAPDECPDEVLS